MNGTVPQRTLDEMVAYYRGRAAEYDEWWYRQGRFDRGPEANDRWFAEMNEVFAALDRLGIAGDVLELAPGTGIWTERLVQRAQTITAVDASPEMVAINKVKVGNVEGVAVNAEAIALHAQRIQLLFPPGSLNAKSKAKADIWQRWPEFQAAAKNLENRAGTLRDQALAKDAAAVQATVATFGRDACGTCHTPFRVPTQQSAQPRS